VDPQHRPPSPEPQLPDSSPPLPPLPSLEHLRKQAKHLLAAARRGEPQALQRLRRWFPERPAFALSHAQLVVAREHGCAGWAPLRRAVLGTLVARLAVRHWSEWRAAAAARAALDLGRPFTTVYADLSGFSGYRALLDVIALLTMYATVLRPDTVVVKSGALKHFAAHSAAWPGGARPAPAPSAPALTVP
jgi:hypothetical protein